MDWSHGIGPGEVFLFLERGEQEPLRHPIHAVAAEHHVCFEIVEDALPLAQQPRRFLVGLRSQCSVAAARYMRCTSMALILRPSFNSMIQVYVWSRLMALVVSMGCANSSCRRLAGLDEFQHQRGRAHLERRGDLAHVRVADDDVETPVLAAVGVRFVARVDERTAVHRVDADHHTEEIRALRNLVEPRLAGDALGLDAHLARAGKNLPGDEKRQNVRSPPGPTARGGSSGNCRGSRSCAR